MPLPIQRLVLWKATQSMSFATQHAVALPKAAGLVQREAREEEA